MDLKEMVGETLPSNNEVNYYVPISSAKEKHYKIKEGLDFIKIIENDRIIGVLNLNTMIPNSNLSKRCCNFKLLEEKCKEYKKE